MKIALLSYEYPPETGNGGIGTYTWYQARALVKLGHTVHVLAGSTRRSDLIESEHDGVRVFRFRSKTLFARGLKKLDSFRLWWTKNRLENALNMRAAFRQLNERYSYDIVEMPECGAEGLFLNHSANIPTVVRLHSPARLIMPFYDVRKTDIKVCSYLEQRGMTGARGLTACSNFMANEGRQKLSLTSPIHVIPNGIDVDLFDHHPQDNDVRQRFAIPADRPLILFAGRMENRKGIFLCKDIVASVLENHNVTFAFAGQDLFDLMKNVLQPYWNAKKLRGTIVYLGKVEPDDVRSLLHACDIFLLPSLWENCPYSCLEAMAAGRAIVSTDQGGMPEMIENGMNGLLAKSGDPASYVQSIERLLDEPALRKRLGDKARNRVQDAFNDIYVAERSAKFYHDLVAGD